MNKSSQDLRPTRQLSVKENMTPAHRQSQSRHRYTNALSSRSNNHSPHRTELATTVSRRMDRVGSNSAIGPTCQNHKNKDARYRIISDDEDTLYYCEKCSIYLASQGFPVEKLQAQANPQSHPQFYQQPVSEPACNNQIGNELQSHIDHVLRNLEEKEQTIRQKIQDAEQYKQEIELNLDAYFKRILDFVHDKKKEFKRFVEAQHRKLLQGYQESEVQIQKALIETYDIKDQISDRQLDSSEKSYFKNCIMKSRIMCEKLDVIKGENKKDIVTIDLSEIVRIIDENLKIKVKSADTPPTEESFQNEQDQSYEEDLGKLSTFHGAGRSRNKNSIGESQIRRLSEHYNSLFSGDGS